MVVGVGVRPQGQAFGRTEGKAGPGHPRGLSVGGQTVDGEIGIVVGPRAVIDHLIGGFRPGDGAEGPHHLPRFFHHIADAPGDLFLHQGRPGVTFPPLVGVAGAHHKGLGGGEDVQQDRQVPGCGRADGHE